MVKASSLGCYRGYSTASHKGFLRSSAYVAMPDGVRVAVDVYRPATGDKPVMGKSPVVVTYARYWRAYERVDGSVLTPVGSLQAGARGGDLDDLLARDGDAGGIGLLLANGYIHVRAEARGTSASFGTRDGDMSQVEAEDGRAIIAWIRRQPWSNGRVAMVGFSYKAMAQLLTASTRPKGLRAIFPAMATFDEYRASWAGGGVLRKYGLAWLAREARQDGVITPSAGAHLSQASADLPARVDADGDGSIRATAMAERRRNADAVDPMSYLTRQTPAAAELERLVGDALGTRSPAEIMETLYSAERLEALIARTPRLREQLAALHFHRDDTPMLTRPQANGPQNLAALAPRISASGVAVYNWGGWRDFATLDTLLWDANLTNPRKLTMGPWAHGPNDPDDRRERASAALLPIEQLRWVDYWLKGVPNGIMAEPRVTYAIWGDGDRFAWRSADVWPPPGLIRSSWYLSKDGALTRSGASGGVASFTVDYGATTGERTRYHGVLGNGPHAFPDLNRHARLGAAAFTTPPLRAPLIVAGSPVVHLAVSATSADANVHAYLERIGADGAVTLLTDGVIRASHRQLGRAPYRNLGLPWSDSRRSIVAATPPLDPDRPAAVVFDLQPIAARFGVGSRIRLVVTGADAHTNFTVPGRAPTRLFVHAGKPMPSRIDLPIMTGSNQTDPAGGSAHNEFR